MLTKCMITKYLGYNIIGHFRVVLASVSKRVFAGNHSYVFFLQVLFHATEIHCHMTGFVRRLVLKQRHKDRHKVTRK